ncbi:LysE family translocator [Colwelliaceae bacterium 6441]
MDLFVLALFLPACFALNMIPGPNNLLSMANGRRYGFKYAVVAGLGRIVAFVVMIFIAASGLAAILYASETIFFTIKVAGGVYLFWVAFNLWRSNELANEKQMPNHTSMFSLAKQEFFLAAGNPKAILIFTAFLPQFIDPALDTGDQFFTLGLIFLSLELIAISLYASFGLYLRHWFSQPSMRKCFNRCCAFFIGAIGLSLFIDRKV